MLTTGFMVPRVLSWILGWGKLGISQEVRQVVHAYCQGVRPMEGMVDT